MDFKENASTNQQFDAKNKMGENSSPLTINADEELLNSYFTHCPHSFKDISLNDPSKWYMNYSNVKTQDESIMSIHQVIYHILKRI